MIARMGEQLGAAFYALSDECVSVHWKWADFLTLYASSTERIEFLNRAAGAFFGPLQGRFWEEILLHLCRLTDPPVTYGKWPNLTVRMLDKLVAPEIAQQVEELEKAAFDATTFARSWRDQRIAHTDLQLAL